MRSTSDRMHRVSSAGPTRRAQPSWKDCCIERHGHNTSTVTSGGLTTSSSMTTAVACNVADLGIGDPTSACYTVRPSRVTARFLYLESVSSSDREYWAPRSPIDYTPNCRSDPPKASKRRPRSTPECTSDVISDVRSLYCNGRQLVGDFGPTCRRWPSIRWQN